MKLNLKELAASQEATEVSLVLTERLPSQIKGPCQMVSRFKISAYPDYYLIEIQTTGKLTIICQRCLGEFDFVYSNQTVLAVCKDESVAEQLMENYECIIDHLATPDLTELVTDELHLYHPSIHENLEDCDQRILNFMSQGLGNS